MERGSRYGLRVKLISLALALVATLVVARSTEAKETYDVLSFDPPAGWTKEVKANTYTCYTIVDQKKKTYCRIFLMASIASKGSIAEDFANEWKNLVVDQYHVTVAAPAGETRTENGWQIRSASTPFTFSGAPATAFLTTMSGGGKEFSIVALSSSDEYLPAIRTFLASVETKKPVVVETTPTPSAGKSYGTCTSITRVLIHYPNKQADTYNSVLLDGLKNAWNVLVAPRYSSVKNLAFKPISGWESIEFAEADVPGAHVVLFKKNYSNGSGRFLEFITPTRAAFDQEFGGWHEASYGWDKMEAMANYNKFMVTAAELQGKWTSNFSGAIQYVNASTGLDAGMDTHASVENFHFGPGAKFQWDLGVASGPVGNIKFQSVKSAGTFSVPGQWSVTFSDIEGKPRTFDAHFSAIKGLRVLWLDGSPYAKAE